MPTLSRPSPAGSSPAGSTGRPTRQADRLLSQVGRHAGTVTSSMNAPQDPKTRPDAQATPATTDSVTDSAEETSFEQPITPAEQVGPRPPKRPGQPDGEPISADDIVSQGGITFFEKAVEDHTRRLLAIARAIVGYRASPEDVVQQALTNLYRHRHRYDWRSPGGLLKRSVVNEALRLLRPPKMSMVADDHPASYRPPESDMETKETVR
ncbi:MAG: sigma factor, partial [Planctomycetota bacterium]